ncbi:MAG: hypothetical protein WA364_25280 [Candidatus Nitrosopolaris sp.]
MAINYDKYYRKIVLDRWEAGKFTSQSGTEAIKRYATEEEVEEEAERDEAALKTRISADDGGDASNCSTMPELKLETIMAVLLEKHSPRSFAFLPPL